MVRPLEPSLQQKMNSDALLTFYAAVSMRFAKRSEALFHSRFEIGSYSKKGRMKVKPLKAGRVFSLLHQQNQNAAEEEETMNSPTSSNLQPLSLLLSSAPLQNHPNVQTVSLIEEQRAIFQEVSCYFGLKLRRACRLRCLKQQQQDGEASSKKEVVGPPKKNKKKNKKKKKTNLGSLIGQLNMENISMHTVNRNFCQNCGYYYGGATLPFMSMIRRYQHQYLNIEVIREEQKKLEGESTTTTPTSATTPKKKINFTRSRVECYRCAFEKWESLQQDSSTTSSILDVKKKTTKNTKCNTHIPILNKEVSVCGRRTNRRKRNRRKTRKENDSTTRSIKKCTQINTVRRVSSRKQLKKLMSTTMMVAPLSQERTTSIGKARIDTESHQKTKKETKSKVERQNKNVTTTATNNKQKLQDLGLW